MPARRTRGGGGGKSQDVYGFVNALHPENAAVNLPSQDKLTAAKAAKFFGRLGFLTIKDLPKDGWRFAKRFVLHHSFSLSPHSWFLDSFPLDIGKGRVRGRGRGRGRESLLKLTTAR